MSRLLLVVMCLAAIPAAGCACPRLSCRYGDPGCVAPPRMAESACGCATEECGCGPADCETGDCGCDAENSGIELAGHRPLLPHWLHKKGPEPSQQHADYVSPLPEFHPVPTRPVFEPLPSYTPPHLLDPPAKMHPMLHPHWQ